MILCMLGVALAGSLDLEVNVQGSLTDVADFGMVATEYGAPPAVGQRVNATSGAFLVIDMAATAHWSPAIEEAMPDLGQMPLDLPSVDLGRTRAPAPLRQRRPPVRPATLHRTPWLEPRLIANSMDDTVTHVDLYARTTPGIGAATVWFGADGSDWSTFNAIEIGSLDTLVASNVAVDDLYKHQLGMWVPDGEVGHQLQHVVYTAIIP